MPALCIYASSSDAIDSKWRETTRAAADTLAAAGFDLVWGCGAVGLMGELGRGFRAAGRRLTGVIPRKLNLPGIVFPDPDELVLTDTMSERKQEMISRAEAFLALPGGFGTLEEILEVITLRQLGYLDKPIALLNSHGFYDSLLAQFELFFTERYAKESFRKLYLVSDDPAAITAYLLAAEHIPLPDKWFKESLDGRADIPE